MTLPVYREQYREELIQVAAVAVAAIQTIDLGRAELSTTRDIFDQILLERIEQNKKFGAQEHDPFVWMTILGEEYGEACQAALKWEFGKDG